MILTTTMTLTPTKETRNSLKLYKVSGVGTPNFWPHDGDLITLNDAHDVVDRRGYFLQIMPEAEDQ